MSLTFGIQIQQQGQQVAHHFQAAEAHVGVGPRCGHGRQQRWQQALQQHPGTRSKLQSSPKTIPRAPLQL